VAARPGAVLGHMRCNQSCANHVLQHPCLNGTSTARPLNSVAVHNCMFDPREPRIVDVARLRTQCHSCHACMHMRPDHSPQSTLKLHPRPQPTTTPTPQLCKPAPALPPTPPGVQGVDVFGRIPQIIAAQAKIAAVLSDNAPEWAADAGWGARINLHVLPDMASIVIGKKGATVQTVQRESGANVRIGKEADSNNLQLVQVRAQLRCCGGWCNAPHSCWPCLSNAACSKEGRLRICCWSLSFRVALL
jgi:hypothetical protein